MTTTIQQIRNEIVEFIKIELQTKYEKEDIYMAWVTSSPSVIAQINNISIPEPNELLQQQLSED